MSKYPTKIDSDAELPRVEDNLSENSVETINALREAIIAIEQTIGINPQGSTANLVQRLSVFFNDDGTAKASALVAAGLIALPITNAMIAANAGIAESKLDLDVATQYLQDQITSSNISMASLQQAMTASLAAYANHVNGIAQKHDGYAILLDKLYPSGTPPWFVDLTANDVSTALAAINNRFIDHASAGKVGAHPASAISVDASALQNVTALNVQGALEQLDETRAVELVDHRDDMHANGLSLWANSTDGYNERNQIVPATIGATAVAFIPSSTTNIIDFTPLSLATFPVKQGDAVAIFDTASIGTYVINDIGPRNAVGTKPSLTAAQLEIVGTFPADGYVSARIYGSSSTILLKGNLASTIHQHDAKVDSLQVSRPNAARVVTLGINPLFIDATHTLTLEVGISSSLSRSITISDLHKDRNGIVVSPPTIDSIVERINYVFQNKIDGFAFPVAAYRVGDELMLSHNWADDFAYIRVTSAGNANFYLGFDEVGSNIVDRYVYPTANAYYYVNGKKLHDVAKITQRTGTASGQYIGFTGFNPIAAGIKTGHLVQVKNHATLNENGTYFITEVTTSAIKVHKAAGLTAQASLEIEVWHDALPLDEFNTNVKDLVIESFITSDGTLGYNERLNYEDVISNLTIVDVSDNFLESTYTLISSVSGGVATLKFDSPYEKLVTVPTTFSGKVNIPSPHQIEYVTAEITAPVGSGSSICKFYDHINEEEVLELCSVRLNGLLTLSNIVDRRMFGTLGLDELREDVVHAYIETPTKELRSNGVISGLDIIDGYYQDPNFPISANVYGVLIRGGAAMVDGTRVETSITSLMFPNVAGTYLIGLNKLGSFKLFDNAQYTMAELLDGYADELALIAQIDHDGLGTVPSSLIDLRYNISKIDDRIDLLFDESNHFIGHFSSFATALQYVNNYPKNEKFKIRVVSHGGSDLDITSVNHNLTVVIDGQVNNVNVSGPCKITSESLGFRTAPQIRGSLTINDGSNNVEVSNISIANGNGKSTLNINTNGVYKFTNVTFDGNDPLGQLYIITAGSPTGAQVEVQSCRFKPGSAINVGSSSIIVDNFTINNCEIYGTGTGSAIHASANNLMITNTLFDNCGIVQTLAFSSGTLVNNCVFRNMTVVSGGAKLINTNSPMIVSNTKFLNISASTDDAIISSTSLSVYAKIDFNQCIFYTCSASVGFKLITSRGSISNSTFDATVCPASPGGVIIECQYFNDNTVFGSSGEFAVGATNVINNNYLTAVTSASFASLQKVVGNYFFPSTILGYNIRNTASAFEVTNNIFSSGSQIAIDVATGTSEVIISHNEFLHSGTCIDFATVPAETVFNSNIIKCATLVTGPGVGEGAIIFSDNIFELAGTFTVSGVTSNVIFDSNMFRNGTLSIDSSSVDGLMINGNIFNSNLIINSDVDGGNISNNAFNSGAMTFNGNISDFIISNNVDTTDIDVTFGAITINRVIISHNIFNFVSMSSAVLSNTLITGNVINTTDVVLNVDPSTSSTDYAHVVFSNNIMDSLADVVLTSTGSIRGVTIDGNIAPNTTGAPFISINNAIVECIITENFNFAITVSAGASSCTISDNIALNENLTLNGALNANIISGNFIENLTISGTSASGFIMNNMYVNNNVTVTAQAGDISGMAFINNVITGNTTFTSSGGDFTKLAFNNNTVNGTSKFEISGTNVSIVSNIFGGTMTLWSVTSNQTLSAVNISNNICSINMDLCSVITGTNVCSLIDSKISGNTIAGNLTFMSGVTSTASPKAMTFNNNVISDNSSDNINIFPSASIRGIIEFSKSSFNNNRLMNDIVINSGSAAPANNTLIDKVLVAGNSLNSFTFGRWLTLDGLSITSNRFNDTSTSISFDIDPVNSGVIYNNLIINDNNMIADAIIDIRTLNSGQSLSRFVISGNIMYDCDFITRLHPSSTSTIDADLVSWTVQSNVMRAFAVRADTTATAVGSTINMGGINISNNAFGGIKVVAAYEPGIYFSKGSRTGTWLSALISIMNNSAVAYDPSVIPLTQIVLHSSGGSQWTMSTLDVSYNKGMDIVFKDISSGISLSKVTMNGNVFNNSTSTRGIWRAGTATTTTLTEAIIANNINGQIDLGDLLSITNTSINNNSLPGGSHILLDSIPTITRVSISNNISTGVTNLDMSGSGVVNTVTVSENVFGSMSLTNYTSATAIGIRGNQFSASPGLNLTSTTANNAALARLALNNNHFAGTVNISTSTAALRTLDDSTISGNVFTNGVTIELQPSPSTGGIDSLTITSNTFDSFLTFGSTSNIDDLPIVGNIISELNLMDITISLSDAFVESNAIFTLRIPPTAIWQAVNTRNGVAGRSIILGNRVSTLLESKGTGFDTAAVLPRCFMFANHTPTGGSLILVTFTGATGRTLDNSNGNISTA